MVDLDTIEGWTSEDTTHGRTTWSIVKKHYIKVSGKAGHTDQDSIEMLVSERLRAKTDLFWLAKDVLDFSGIMDRYVCWDHPMFQAADAGPCRLCKQPMSTYWPEDSQYHKLSQCGSPHRTFADFFVKKDPTKSIMEQDEIRERLLMAPRGSYKTACDEADCIQWIIAFPNVRILLLSAAENLGIEVVDKVKSFFGYPVTSTKEKVPIHLTWFQCLFPDHCLPIDKLGSSGEFTTPARTSAFKGIEPSIMAFGLRATKSGYHFEVGKFDDCVSDANSGPMANEESREKIAQTIRLARGLIMPLGYRDIIGTPYDEHDAYEHLVEAAERNPEEMKFIRIPAWVPRTSGVNKSSDEMLVSDYDYLFPITLEDGKKQPHHDFKYLRKIQRDSENAGDNVFSCQFLCQAISQKRKVQFTEAILRSHTVTPDATHSFPQIYTAISSWDLAYSKTKDRRRDFTVGSVGWFDPFGRLFVKEVIRDKYTKYELAAAIAQQAIRWHVESIKIEGSNGADFLETDIRNALTQGGYADCPIDFFPVDNTKDAKSTRAELLEGMLLNDRLFFSSEIPIMDIVISEFARFSSGGSRKDDIVDSVAHLARFSPPPTEIPSSQAEIQRKLYEVLYQKTEMDRVFMHPDPPPRQYSAPEQIPMTTFDGAPIVCPTCRACPCICF